MDEGYEGPDAIQEEPEKEAEAEAEARAMAEAEGDLDEDETTESVTVSQVTVKVTHTDMDIEETAKEISASITSEAVRCAAIRQQETDQNNSMDQLEEEDEEDLK